MVDPLSLIHPTLFRLRRSTGARITRDKVEKIMDGIFKFQFLKSCPQFNKK